MIVDVQSLNAYSGNWEDNDAAVTMKELFLGSAEEIVSDYLRYSPVLGLHADIVLSGNGTGRLQLPSRPVRSLERMEIDGCTMDVALFRLDDDRITAIRRTVFPRGDGNIVVSYTSGWKAEEMPNAIRVAILRIATLMLSETDGNIGLTGKSFADNSRTFVNYSNYRKYLEPLAGFRVTGF